MTRSDGIEPLPGDDDAIQRLIDELYEFLTSPQPEDGVEGPELAITLDPNDYSDDPRAIALLQLIGELERSSKSSESGSVDFSVGLLHAGHQTRDVTEAVKAEFGEKLDEQTRKTTEDRAKGAPRSLTPHEQIKLRESFRQAVSSLNVFANDLADYCAERLRTGCKWWECEVPPPIRRVLEPTAVVATGAALLTAPVPTLVVAVAVVAVVARRKRSS